MNLLHRLLLTIGMTVATTLIAVAPPYARAKYGRRIGTTHKAGPVPTFAYVANTDDGTISEFAVRPDGKFALLTTIALPRALFYTTESGYGIIDREPLQGFQRQKPLSPVVTPDGRFAYFVDIDDGVVLQYRVTPAGRLTPLSPPQVAAGIQPVAIALDPGGRFAYIASDSGISAYRIAPGGGLILLSSPEEAARGCAIAVTPNGHFLYDNLSEDLIRQYTIGVDGTLRPLVPPVVAAGSRPRSLAISPDGRSAYAVDLTQSLVLQYRIRPNGTLKLLSPPYLAADPEPGRSPFWQNTNPSSITLALEGRSAYVVDSDPQAVSQFRVRPDGTLAPLRPVLVRLTAPPISVAFSLDGHFAYVPNGREIARFRVAADGTLQPLSPAWVSPRDHPACLVLLRQR